jgi:hypothetical protein
MKTWAGGGIAPLILTSAMYGGKWSDSRPGCFTPCTHWTGGAERAPEPVWTLRRRQSYILWQSLYKVSGYLSAEDLLSISKPHFEPATKRLGTRGSLVEALCYKPEGCRFESRIR